MGNGVRHFAGGVAGLLAVPLIAAGLMYGSTQRYQGTAQLTIGWPAIAALAGTVIVIGVLAGSRISPVASLLPGVAFTGFGGAALVRIGTGGDHRMGFDLVPSEYLSVYTDLLYTWSFVIGGLLLAASVFPSRWRARESKEEEEAVIPERPTLPKRVPFAAEKITSPKSEPGPATRR